MVSRTQFVVLLYMLYLVTTDHEEYEFDPNRTELQIQNGRQICDGEEMQCGETKELITNREYELDNLPVAPYIPPSSIHKVCRDKWFWLIVIGLIISAMFLIISVPFGFLYTTVKTSTQTKSITAIYNAQPGSDLLYAVYIGDIKGHEHSKVNLTTDYEFLNDNVTIVLSKEIKKKSNPPFTINQSLTESLRTRYVAGGFNYTVNITGAMESLINISVSIVNDHIICSSGFKVIGNSSVIPFNCASDEMGYYGFDFSGNGIQEGVLTYEILDVEYYNKMLTSLACVLYSTNTTCSIQLSSNYQGTYHIIAILPPIHVQIHAEIIEGRDAVFWIPVGFSIALIISTILLLLLLVIRICKVII